MICDTAALCVVAGFWVAVIARSLYAGVLADLDLEARTILGWNLNQSGFILLLAVLVIGTGLTIRNRPKPIPNAIDR